MSEPLIACCDLGGTKMLVGLVSLEGNLLASEKYLIGERNDPAIVVSDVEASVERLLAQLGAERSDVAAFGCSNNGVLNFETGVVAMNHNMGWVDVPFRDLLAECFGVPVTLEMDANAAALGERWQGAAQGLDSFAFVIVGTGIGAGLVLDGRIVHGAHGTAGELGHTVIVQNGPLCGCGKHGCLEALSSGLAIARKANAALMLGRESSLRQLAEPISALHVVEAARAGDTVAREVIDDAGFYLGIGLANLITLLDPQAIVLGGGVGLGAGDLLLPALERSLQQHLNYWSARNTPILPSNLGDNAGLLGAAQAALASLSQTVQSEAAK
ncbi:MAG: ROK family protein [Anaerolineae bacterium]|nr:ROK family protein [Anaerolineae bacterium]